MRRPLPILAVLIGFLLLAALLLAGCGGAKAYDAERQREEDFQWMVDAINAQHPPLYDGTNTSYPPPES